MIHAVARSAHAVTDGQERRDALGELLELTSAMLEAALSGEWERLVALEATRQERIHEFFSTPPGQEEAAEIARAIRVILDTDRQVMRLGSERMEWLGDRLRGVRKGRAATSAYRAATAGG